MIDFTELNNIRFKVPSTYIVTVSVQETHYDVHFFDIKTAMEKAELYTKCQDTEYVDILDGMTGEVLIHYKGQMF